MLSTSLLFGLALGYSAYLSLEKSASCGQESKSFSDGNNYCTLSWKHTYEHMSETQLHSISVVSGE